MTGIDTRLRNTPPPRGKGTIAESPNWQGSGLLRRTGVGSTPTSAAMSHPSVKMVK